MKREINQRRPYVRPAMQVYELRETSRLLVGSTGTEDYNYGGSQTWPAPNP